MRRVSVEAKELTTLDGATRAALDDGARGDRAVLEMLHPSG